MRARSAITSRSPTRTSRPGNRSRASSAHKSGPMPAGSPAVRATTASLALVVAVLDERAVALAKQDVAHVRLLHAGGGRLAALLEELHDVEAVRAAQDVAHVAVLELLQHLEEERGKPCRLAPAEGAALQCVGRVGVGRGH